MNRITTIATYAVVAIAAIAVVGLPAVNAADPDTSSALSFNYDIDPRCTDAAAGQSLFQLTNKETRSIAVTYINADSTDTGVKSLEPGVVTDVYVKTEPTKNNQVIFSAGDAQMKAINANFAPCDGSTGSTETPGSGAGTGTDAGTAPGNGGDTGTGTGTTPGGSGSGAADPSTQPACTDARNAQNLDVNWVNDSQITITTKDGTPICDTVELYYSTYGMPDTYDNSGSFNSTAYPQTLDKSFRFTLDAGAPGVRLINVPAPNYCYNIQADVYYGPEITGIDANGNGVHGDGSTIAYGHGTQNIESHLFAKDASQCTAGRGAGASIDSSAIQSVLPDTGRDLTAVIVTVVVVAAAGAAGMLYAGYRMLRR